MALPFRLFAMFQNHVSAGARPMETGRRAAGAASGLKGPSLQEKRRIRAVAAFFG
jgi:hypothetical protein